jgi:hypothetical protein
MHYLIELGWFGAMLEQTVIIARTKSGVRVGTRRNERAMSPTV